MSLSVSSGKQWAEEQSDIHAVKTVAATLTRSYLSVLLLSWNAPTQTPLLRSICKLAVIHTHFKTPSYCQDGIKVGYRERSRFDVLFY